MKFGTGSPDAIREALERETVRRRLESNIDRWPWVTLALVGSHLTLFVATGVSTWMSGHVSLFRALFWARGPAGLERWGSRVSSLVWGGEPWRLVTSTFLHWDVLHILLNSLALLGLGRLMEAVHGRSRFLWLYLVCGLSGSLLSEAVHSNEAGAVGASGAIYGLMGAAIVFGWRFRTRLDPELRRLFGRGIIPWVVLNVVITFVVPSIDVPGHFGGLFGGAVCASFLGSPVIPGREGPEFPRLLMAFASSALLSWSLAALVLERLG